MEVNEKIKNIIIKTFKLNDNEEIKMSTDFRMDLNIRQLDLITLICVVEKEFNIVIDDSLILTSDTIRTVSDLCSLIEKQSK